MRLYKNVDICDLESIIERGILSLDESNNNNWMNDGRAENPTDCVYMFQPIGNFNTATQYGLALLAIDIPDEIVTARDIPDNDINKENYMEFVAAKVALEYITAIYIPEILKARVTLQESIANRVTWCEMSAEYYKGFELTSCSADVLVRLAATCGINSNDGRYFRGVFENREVLDVYNVKYVL